MCNQRFELHDWKNKPCDKCKSTVWNLKSYYGNGDARDTIACGKCKTEYCVDCGDWMKVDEILKDGFRLVETRRLRNLLAMLK